MPIQKRLFSDSHHQLSAWSSAALGLEQFGLERLDLSSSTRLTAERLRPNGRSLELLIQAASTKNTSRHNNLSYPAITES
jgi:hypothetical protein